MELINKRLKEARKAAGLTQSDLASLGGVSLNSQARYETTERKPDAKYLSLVWDKIDVPYVLSGVRQSLKSAEESAEYNVTKKVIRQLDYDELGFTDQLDLLLKASHKYEEIIESIEPPKPSDNAFKDVRAFVAFTHLTEKGVFQLIALLQKARRDDFWIDN